MLEDIYGGMSHGAAAMKYGISRAYVGQIVNGKACWDFGDVDKYELAEMSEEDLDAMIEEQLPTMPKEPSDGYRWPRLPQAVQRGMGLQARHRRDV
jgi:hypothetical protein